MNRKIVGPLQEEGSVDKYGTPSQFDPPGRSLGGTFQLDPCQHRHKRTFACGLAADDHYPLDLLAMVRVFEMTTVRIENEKIRPPEE
jgi:hypothetical protein